MAQDPKIAKAFQVLMKDIPQNFDPSSMMGGKGKKESAPEPPK